jgi:hypothetical protein
VTDVKLIHLGLTVCICASLTAELACAGSADTSQATQCQQLVNADFSEVAEAPTQVTSSSLIAPASEALGYCRATGYVAPNVGFELRLPTAWNGKLMYVGSGGHGGFLNADACSPHLKRGYACIVSDMGHQSTALDAKWAYNNLQAEIDWGYRGTHVAALAGKAIVSRFYSKDPVRSYYIGCSTGGRQGLQEAQRFPWDFDGIIAGAPPTRLADLYVTFAWGQRVTHDDAGHPLLGTSELKLLTDGALAKCDANDGLKDGIIGAPMSCSFRPSELVCTAGQESNCLTPRQVRAAEQVYSGPTNSDGKSLFGGGALPGSEHGGAWNAEHGGNWGIYYLGRPDKAALYAPLTLDGLRYLFFSPDPGPTWKITDFDFEEDYKRLDVMQSLYDASNPDLGRFKAAGGKLIIYQGYNDLSILPHWTFDYYTKVERVMGGKERTQDFLRVFALPGVEHCAGGAGADNVDYVSYLEDWVERGRAPDKLIAFRLRDGDRASRPAVEYPIPASDVAFSRPVYPYPLGVRYKGKGDPNSADNFAPSKK